MFLNNCCTCISFVQLNCIVFVCLLFCFDFVCFCLFTCPLPVPLWYGEAFLPGARAKKCPPALSERNVFALMVCLNRRLGPISPWNWVGGNVEGETYRWDRASTLYLPMYYIGRYKVLALTQQYLGGVVVMCVCGWGRELCG